MNLVSLFRLCTLIEGISYLTLLLVAMPLKYVFGIPLAVRIVGGIHGVLFLSFILLLYQTHLEQKWTLRHSASLFLASLIPGSLFWLDRRIQRGASP